MSAGIPSSRHESRLLRIATVVQRMRAGEIPTAMDAAREIERIIDNSLRAKRRKAGAK